MVRVVLAIIRLYFAIGIILAAILFGSAIYHYFAITGAKPPFLDVAGRALLDAVFRIFVWGPQLVQYGMHGSQSFLDWLLLPRRPEA
jgi:hypothetical protein